jgi:hypothetical protein
MQQTLMEKLHQFLVENNIDLLISLQLKSKVSSYLKNKVDSISPLLDDLLAENTPAYIIEERCMQELTKDLRPSRFNYIRAILEEEFEMNFNSLVESGILTYELINLINACKPVFETVGFTEVNENDRGLRYAIVGAIKEYFETRCDSEKVKYGI